LKSQQTIKTTAKDPPKELRHGEFIGGSRKKEFVKPNSSWPFKSVGLVEDNILHPDHERMTSAFDPFKDLKKNNNNNSTRNCKINGQRFQLGINYKRQTNFKCNSKLNTKEQTNSRRI
jgi:hypothetical protein